MDNYIDPYAYYLSASLFHKTSSMSGGASSTDKSIEYGGESVNDYIVSYRYTSVFVCED